MPVGLKAESGLGSRALVRARGDLQRLPVSFSASSLAKSPMLPPALLAFGGGGGEAGVIQLVIKTSTCGGTNAHGRRIAWGLRVGMADGGCVSSRRAGIG